MPGLRKYRKKAGATVVAVQIDLETEGFSYRKWGGLQRCQAGDYLVCNAGDTYTVARETFERTYTSVTPGIYRKTTVVWAEIAEESGSVGTQEGVTNYDAGDYLVYNASDRGDGYAVSAASFREMYEIDED